MQLTTTTTFVNAAIFDGHRYRGTSGVVVLEDGRIQAVGLVVLDRDPFAADPSEIGAAGVASTWVDGVAVHQV